MNGSRVHPERERMVVMKTCLTVLLVGVFSVWGVAQQETSQALDGFVPSALVPEQEITFTVEDAAVSVPPSFTGEQLTLHAVGVYDLVVTNSSDATQVVKLVRVSGDLFLLENQTGMSVEDSLTLEPGETRVIRFTATTDRVGTWALSSGQASSVFVVN